MRASFSASGSCSAAVRSVPPVMSTHGQNQTAPPGSGLPSWRSLSSSAIPRPTPDESPAITIRPGSTSRSSHPVVGALGVVELGREGVLGCEPVLGPEDRVAGGAARAPITPRWPYAEPNVCAPPCRYMTVAGRDGSGPMRNDGHAARVDRLDRDPGRRRELRAQAFDRGTALSERDAVLGGREDGRPVLAEPERELAAHRLRARDRFADVFQQAMRALQQRLARQGELDPMRRAAQQSAADQLLQRTDLAAQRRLRHVQPVRGAGEVELFGDGDEGAQVAQLDRVPRLWEGQHVVGSALHQRDYAPRRRGDAMRSAQRCLARSDFRARDDAPKMGAMHSRLTAVGRSADLRLRGRAGPGARPLAGQAAARLADARRRGARGPGRGQRADDALCDALCAGLGALVLHVFWDRRLERAAGALDWAADHAAELERGPATHPRGRA